MKKIFKRIAAVATGAAMLGATLTSALALDLAEYPSPFSVDGKHDTSTRIVVGDIGKVEDTIAAADISQELAEDSYTVAGTGGTSVVVSGGKTDEIPISSGADCGIATCVSVTYLDQELEDDDVASLQDSSLTFKSKTIDFHDALVLGQYSPRLESSLVLGDDDFETDIVMTVEKDQLKYYYLFDEGINLSTASSTDSAEIKFLGNRLKITAATATSITAQIGEEFFMDVDDVVTVEGKTVTLLNVASSSVSIDVDGQVEIISDGGTETINGLEVHVDEVFDADTKGERSAVIVMGEDAADTYTDGEDYSQSIEYWDWDIGGLTASSSSTLNLTGTPTVSSGPFIGIENDFTVNSDDDEFVVSTNAAHADCYTFPNDYIQVCLDSLTVADSDYITVKIELETSLDTTKAQTDGGASENAILITTPNENEGLEVESTNLTNLTSDFKTNKIWIHHNKTQNFVDVYYHDSSDTAKSPKWAGKFNVSNPTTNIGRVNFQDTKGTDIEFDLIGTDTTATATTDMINLTLDILGKETSSPVNGDDDINIRLSHSATAFDGIGATPDSEEAGELIWNTTTIGTKDEDHRSIYGIIIRDPKGHGANDEVVFDVPGEQVLGNVVIKGTSTAIAGGAGGNRINVPITSTLTVKSSEVGSASAHHLILVGGPCVNPTISQVSGLSAYSSCEGWGLEDGEAVLKLVDNGDKVALLVAGTNADDTRAAGKVIKDYGDYDLSGTEKVVKHVGLTDITVA